MFDADRVLVRAHAMIRTVAIAYHLVNVAVSINNVMRGNLPAICFLKFPQSAGKRPFRAVQHNLVDACAVTARTMWAFDELFDYWFCVRVATSMAGAAYPQRRFYWYGSPR